MLNENTNLNNFTYREKNSLDMGLFIMEKSAPYGSAQPIIEKVSIPAKGNVIVDDRADTLDNQEHNDFTKTYTCCIAADEGTDLDVMARNIYGWLFKEPAYSELYDTYEKGYYRMAHIGETATVEELAKNLLGGIEISFVCKAYKRSIKGDRTITITAPTDLYNTEEATALPYIKIYGNGNITLYINDRSHSFSEVSSYIEVDSELMNCYKGNILQNSKMNSDTFPKLAAGVNSISWAGNVTKVEIKPRWCCL